MAVDFSRLDAEETKTIAESVPSPDGFSPSDIAHAIRISQDPFFGITERDNENKYNRRGTVTDSGLYTSSEKGYTGVRW